MLNSTKIFAIYLFNFSVSIINIWGEEETWLEKDKDDGKLEEYSQINAKMANLVALSECLRLLLVSDDVRVGGPGEKMRRNKTVNEGQGHCAN